MVTVAVALTGRDSATRTRLSRRFCFRRPTHSGTDKCKVGDIPDLRSLVRRGVRRQGHDVR
eukprot:849885-Pyramimonas_sp.AAC.1